MPHTFDVKLTELKEQLVRYVVAYLTMQKGLHASTAALRTALHTTLDEATALTMVWHTLNKSILIHKEAESRLQRESEMVLEDGSAVSSELSDASKAMVHATVALRCVDDLCTRSPFQALTHSLTCTLSDSFQATAPKPSKVRE